MRARTFRRAALISAAVILLAPINGSAGTQIDPNVGDDVLGTVGGLRYASDPVAYDPFIDHADIEVGCGGPRWHLLGGGSAASGPIGQTWQTSDRPTDFDVEA